jgi:uncharacterized protein
MMPLITSQFVEAIRTEFRLDWRGVHGVNHWARVRTNGLTIAAANGANKSIVEYFAFLHDACRQTDGRDHGHGQRAALFARSIRKRLIKLDDDEFELLLTAIEGHTNGQGNENPVVSTCWDADRLDLIRIGVVPDPSRLCTEAGRKLANLRERNPNMMSALVSDQMTLIARI